jgi:membrane-associated phospholipid phosphatase
MRVLSLFVTAGCLAGQMSFAQAPPPVSTALPDTSFRPAAALPPLAPVPRPRLRTDILRVAIPVAVVAVGYWGSHRQNIVYEMREEMQEETREMFPTGLQTKADDYSRHAPIWAAYAFHVVGLKPARGVVPFTICYGLAHALSTGVVNSLKKRTVIQRPDNNNDFSSFPSAHTAEAFMTATLLHEQFGARSPWISVGGYAVATATGAMRVVRNRHWITDVAAGAGIGFLSAEAVWRLYPKLARLVPGRLSQKLLLVPAYLPGGGVGLTMALK